MTQEDRELLLKDLSARLPYGVKMHSSLSNLCYEKDFILDAITLGKSDIYFNDEGSASYSKPCLFPITSMTEEQKKEVANIDKHGNIYFKISKEYHTNDSVQIDIKDMSKYLDWLNKNHFDYRGLIDKGLAIDATNLNIY